MDKAKESVKKFMSNSGNHDTTVHERVAPAVQHEEVARTEHESATTAVDREVHQDHYHTTEQPVQHAETLPEQHHHNLMPVEHKSYEHDNADDVKRRLADESSKYRDERTRVEGEHTSEAAPTVAGEHVHHHVHENIQPVVHKQTVEPHVVHTTVPVHEVHHNAAQHHSSTALPPVSMEDFKKQGGTLGGREERHDQFPGEPRSIGDSLRDGGKTDRATTDGLEMDGRGTEPKESNIDPADVNRNATSSSTTSSTQNPSLMDKLNPKKDADGDDKTGVMK